MCKKPQLLVESPDSAVVTTKEHTTDLIGACMHSGLAGLLFCSKTLLSCVQGNNMMDLLQRACIGLQRQLTECYVYVPRNIEGSDFWLTDREPKLFWALLALIIYCTR